MNKETEKCFTDISETLITIGGELNDITDRLTKIEEDIMKLTKTAK